MKKYLAIIAVVILAVLMLTGCAADNELVGKWEHIEAVQGMSYRIEYSFLSGGKFESSEKFGTSVAKSGKGEYKVSDNVVTISYDGNTLTYSYVISEDGQTLSLQSTDNDDADVLEFKLVSAETEE